MRSSAVAVLAVLALLFVGLSSAAKDPTLITQIKGPGAVVTKVTGYTSNGIFTPLTTACQNPALFNPCIHIVEQGSTNSVTISWTPSTNTTILPTANLTSYQSVGGTVSLFGCFSNVSSFDAAWRKPKPLIRKDTQCKISIKKNLPLTGTFNWTLDGNVPTATVFVRAYIEVPSPLYGTTPKAYGDSLKSSGFFQTQQINHHPPALIAAATVCACVGPLVLGAFFLYERLMKKHK